MDGQLRWLSFAETATIQTVLDYCTEDKRCVVITYDDTEILEDCRLVDYPTSETKPICISEFRVYYSIDDSYVCSTDANKLFKVFKPSYQLEMTGLQCIMKCF